jgi:hypothetical protein
MGVNVKNLVSSEHTSLAEVVIDVVAFCSSSFTTVSSSMSSYSFEIIVTPASDGVLDTNIVVVGAGIFAFLDGVCILIMETFI